MPVKNKLEKSKALTVQDNAARLYGDLSSLDIAFQLPERITDPDLRQLYEVMVYRMRIESAHLPMNTHQQLWIERIANYYITILDWERSSKFNMRDATKYNNFWMTMSAQFNTILMRSAPASQRDAFLQRIAMIIAEVLQTVDDNHMKIDLFNKFMESFKREGLN